MAVLLRSRLGIYAIVTLGVILFTVVVIVGYRLYDATIADTPEKAVRLYLDALNKGDMVKLYDMTRASGQTQAEFAAMMETLVKDRRLSADVSALEHIGRHGAASYYRAMAKLRTADDSYRLSPLVLEAAKDGRTWRVGLYLPPAAMPSP